MPFCFAIHGRRSTRAREADQSAGSLCRGIDGSHGWKCALPRSVGDAGRLPRGLRLLQWQNKQDHARATALSSAFQFPQSQFSAANLPDEFAVVISRLGV